MRWWSRIGPGRTSHSDGGGFRSRVDESCPGTPTHLWPSHASCGSLDRPRDSVSVTRRRLVNSGLLAFGTAVLVTAPIAQGVLHDQRLGPIRTDAAARFVLLPVESTPPTRSSRLPRLTPPSPPPVPLRGDGAGLRRTTRIRGALRQRRQAQLGRQAVAMGSGGPRLRLRSPHRHHSPPLRPWPNPRGQRPVARGGLDTEELVTAASSARLSGQPGFDSSRAGVSFSYRSAQTTLSRPRSASFATGRPLRDEHIPTSVNTEWSRSPLESRRNAYEGLPRSGSASPKNGGPRKTVFRMLSVPSKQPAQSKLVAQP